MNSMPKHEAQAIVASFDSQYWHCGESDEIAAPQFGQLRVCACIGTHASCVRCAGIPARFQLYHPHPELSIENPLDESTTAVRCSRFNSVSSLFFSITTLRLRVNIFLTAARSVN